jgi:hypothetical protein
VVVTVFAVVVNIAVPVFTLAAVHRRRLSAWWRTHVPGPVGSAAPRAGSEPAAGPGTTIAIRHTTPLFDPRRDWRPRPVEHIVSGPRVRPEMRGQWTAIAGTWKQDTMRALEAGWEAA